ncbi:MAG: YkvI family membrane protein [Thermoanaerobaculia bacterium]
MSGVVGPAGILRRLLSGRFGALLLPAIVLQSVLIGGGYATGREIVTYGGRFGAHGWLAVVAIFVGFSLLAMLTFEVARVFAAYEYKGFIRQLIGPLWPAFDLLFGVMAVLVIAVMASAAANILHDTLGLSMLAGTGAIVVAVAVLTYFGAAVIEAFKSVGSALLYGAYLVFGVLVLNGRWERVVEVFARGDVSAAPEAGPGGAFAAGVLYVGYNLVVFPAVLFTLHRQTTRRETLWAGLIAGFLMTAPFALTYLCLLAFYPSAEVLDAPVPWLPMLRQVGGGGLLVLFGVVMGWTLLETSVGLIHALLDRIDRNRRRRLTRLQSVLLGVGVLLLAALLSRVGIIALVARGYSFMGYLLIALFALPLLTVGTFRILKPQWRPELRIGRRSPGGESRV